MANVGPLAALFFFLPCAMIYAYLRATTAIAGGRGETRRIEALQPTIASVAQLLSMASELGALLLFSWVCENLVESGERMEGQTDLFWFLFLLLILASLTRVVSNKVRAFLC